MKAKEVKKIIDSCKDILKEILGAEKFSKLDVDFASFFRLENSNEVEVKLKTSSLASVAPIIFNYEIYTFRIDSETSEIKFVKGKTGE